jgi:hypothetical protein
MLAYTHWRLEIAHLAKLCKKIVEGRARCKPVAAILLAALHRWALIFFEVPIND